MLKTANDSYKEMQQQPELKDMGSESIAGEDCIHYHFDGAMKGQQVLADVWVAKSDGIIRQAYYATDTGNGKQTYKLTFSQMNAVPDILPPPEQ